MRAGGVGEEVVPLAVAWGRVLAQDVVAAVDVPAFDRANVDGFAVRAADTFGAREEAPRRLHVLGAVVTPGAAPACVIEPGTAVAIATGGMLPRGADAVVMVEYAELDGANVVVRKAVMPGGGVTFAGTDITAGETVLRAGERLTSRETGVLAAIGAARVAVWRRPVVAIFSTGDELVAPGESLRPGEIFDSNAQILADGVRELGAVPLSLGIVPDDADLLRQRLDDALEQADLVLLSGGTSKGAGDICYRVVAELRQPGIVAHGVALKPGKPLCLAVTRGKPVVVLPGFPTSAIFTFHEFVAPVLRDWGGLGAADERTTPARLAVRVNSEIGRTEYVLVGLVPGDESSGDSLPIAYPLGKGSGSVTAFSRADGFLTIGRHEEIVERGTVVDVRLLARELRPADLVVMGSHCVGLDVIVNQLARQGLHCKLLAVGSTAGLEAAKQGACDLAPVHLLDEASGVYNRPFLTDDLTLVPGYQRMQGVVFRRDDVRFAGRDRAAVETLIRSDPQCRMVNRNVGSGTRVLIDRLLAGVQPPGYAVQPRSHQAVAAAVRQGRADWGVAIASVIESGSAGSELGFMPLAEECYDFVIPRSRRDRPAVKRFIAALADPMVREQLAAREFRLLPLE